MGERSDRTVQRAVRATVFVVALLPLARLIFDGVTGGLGTNPIEELTHRTGWWALTFLMLTLAVTPVRKLLAIGWLVKLRRMLGLYAFFYASLHFGVYIGIDQFFAFAFIIEDIMDRPYITVGFAALVILAPLAVTSTKRMIRRLGGRRWNLLHSLVYLAGGLGVIHFLWLVKADTRRPMIFGLILVGLLAFRLIAPRVLRLKARARRSETGRSARATGQSGAPSLQHAEVS